MLAPYNEHNVLEIQRSLRILIDSQKALTKVVSPVSVSNECLDTRSGTLPQSPPIQISFVSIEDYSSEIEKASKSSWHTTCQTQFASNILIRFVFYNIYY